MTRNCDTTIRKANRMSDDRTLVLERTLAAPPEKVWRCWTEPDLIKQWFAPKPVLTTEVEIDLRPGGIFRTVMEVPDHGTMAGDPGCILLVEDGQRLVWTSALGPGFHPNAFSDDPMSFPFTADIRIEPDGDGCRYVAIAMHASQTDSSAHEQMGFMDGWGAAVDQLGALAASL